MTDETHQQWAEGDSAKQDVQPPRTTRDRVTSVLVMCGFVAVAVVAIVSLLSAR